MGKLESCHPKIRLGRQSELLPKSDYSGLAATFKTSPRGYLSSSKGIFMNFQTCEPQFLTRAASATRSQRRVWSSTRALR